MYFKYIIYHFASLYYFKIYLIKNPIGYKKRTDGICCISACYVIFSYSRLKYFPI
jgi:hypothetical protein